jgi:glyoxylase-like metal-dependent hydrolase (beta-lactamase superfamily II)/8-oxo-dGTP pyrophosphatase MutT (NUDIX family)
MSKPVTPKDAAAVILLKHNSDKANPQVFWARRSLKLAFMGGFHAFAGGQRDEDDSKVNVANCDDEERATMIACAARELFEETGVLVVRDGERLTVGQRASILDDLISGRMKFAEMLAHYGLYLDADDFTFVGRWVTPPFAPRRFDTWFFLVHCPAKQQPSDYGLRIADCGFEGESKKSVPPAVAGGSVVLITHPPATAGGTDLLSCQAKHFSELEDGEWISASEAVARWHRSEVVIAPPILYAMETLSKGLTDDLVERFLSSPNANRGDIRRIEFRPGFIFFPVRTPTLPPATHTNCFIIGGDEFIVIDPASPYEEEQKALAQCVDELIAEGRTMREIILSHLHQDHVSGANALQQHLQNKVPIAAHRITAESVKDEIAVTRFIEDEEIITLKGRGYIPDINLKALHTPGHARGHLCFYEETTGTLLTSDNVVGLGSVLIAPPEGNMKNYLTSLERLRSLPNLKVLFGAHGPAIANPYAKIDEYISHRLEREANIFKAIREGAHDVKEIVERVYTDVHPKALPLAEHAVSAHLEKLGDDGFVKREKNEWKAMEKRKL